MAARKKANPIIGPLSEAEQELLKNLRRDRPISVCFFNNKGGVGKTTLVANFAAVLAKGLNLRILVVDADPQCNLTQYMIPEDDFVSTYGDRSKNADISSIFSIVHPLSIGKGYQERLPVLHAEKFGVDIIMGDPRLALKEDLLSQDWRDAKSGGTRGLRTTLIFHDLVSRTKNYDFVFFDMGPSLGAINRSILLAVDSFVVPMTIDIFSLWAIRNIGEALTIWKKELETGIRLAEDPSEVAFFNQFNNPRFVGYVTQQHKEKSEKGSPRIVQAYKEISDNLPTDIKDFLGRFYLKNEMNPHLGDIKHLGSLAPKSQNLHEPMVSVNLTGSYTLLRKRAREIYRSMAFRFIENFNDAA